MTPSYNIYFTASRGKIDHIDKITKFDTVLYDEWYEIPLHNIVVSGNKIYFFDPLSNTTSLIEIILGE